jgi:hypothetical protein
MPATARQYGYQAGDLFSPDVQRYIYNRQMSHLLSKFGGDPDLALAAWNTGEGNVERGRIPAETRSYVPKVLSRLGGAISGALGEGTAYAEEPPATGKRMPQKFQYSPSTGTFWSPGPDGNPVQVQPDQVPADIRAKATKTSAPSGAAAKLPARVPPTPPNLEQRYERQFARLPTPLQYVAPGTIGEAAATGANLGALALAPETGGLSLVAPIAAAGIGGYMEPSDQPWLSGQRFERAGIEAGKEIGGLVGAKAIGKGAELVGRYAGKVPMLERSAARIGRGVAGLFNNYPAALPVPETMDALRRDVADGRLKEVVGERLGQFRRDLAAKIPEYKPAQAAVPKLYGPGPVKAVGEKFTLPDVDAEGHLFDRDFGISEGIEHVERMNSLSYSVKGQPKGGELSFAYRKAGHEGREALEKGLNKIGPKYGLPDAGTQYLKHSADYGTAAELTNAFQKGNVGRTITAGGKRIEVIDQPALKKALDKESMEHLSKLQGEGKKELFRHAVAPEGGIAREESGGHGTVSPDLWHTLVGMLGSPFTPESRKMLPPVARALTARRGAVPVTRALATPLVAAPRQALGPLIHMDIIKTPEEMRSEAGR